VGQTGGVVLKRPAAAAAGTSGSKRWTLERPFFCRLIFRDKTGLVCYDMRASLLKQAARKRSEPFAPARPKSVARPGAAPNLDTEGLGIE